MQFDPTSAAAIFAQKSTDELIQIAFLEQDYTKEAKELAEAQLAIRGTTITPQDIERVRLRMDEEKREVLEYSLNHLESDEAMPSWRRSVRARIAPHHKGLTVVALALMALAELNAVFDWGFVNLHGRKSEGVGLLVGLLWMVFVLPSREYYLGRGSDKKGS